MPKEMRITLVTGASKGIGAGIAKCLSENNYIVYGTFMKYEATMSKFFKNNKNVRMCNLDVRNEKR
ncbi:MAG: hypothetical protein KGH61_04045 [Candidatus Micrarchaeota archaeon]|nr:hypothetical protein [Candidatus Micrarchaeota archaeon]MDE1848092.1 hypothetical protein [Candidatus Micrarchaeota archaeon]MDE1864780.1 hypothetical protein [Candidatus Micrarchaeota archaeon]